MLKNRKFELIALLLATICIIGVVVNMPEEKAETDTVEVTEKTGNVEIIEKADASYEKWLAAAMVTAVSMQYADFTIDGIYLTGETDVASKENSQGAYVMITSGDEQIVIQSKPLEEERVETKTIDLYTRDLGFSTFDTVDAVSMDMSSFQEITMDDLGELISQSLLVSLYEH